MKVGDKVAYRTIRSGNLKGKVLEVHFDGPTNTGTVVWKVTSKGNPHYKRGQLMSSHASNPFLWVRR